MFKLVHKNRKGFSLVELIVTVAVLAMVVPLAGQILFQFLNVFNAASGHWDIQSAVQLACNKLESQNDVIVNSYQADILYDPVVDRGITYNDATSKFTWTVPGSVTQPVGSGGKTEPYVMPNEGVINADDPYTYLFSAPTYDSKGVYRGYYLFIRHPHEQYSRLLLENTEHAKTPVKVNFTVGFEFEEFELDANGKPKKDDTGKLIHKSGRSQFLERTVSVLFSSGRPDIYTYSMKSDYSLANINRRKINYDINNQLVFDIGWMSGGNPVAGPAGWIDIDYNQRNDESLIIPSMLTPADRAKFKYPESNTSIYGSHGEQVTFTDAFLQQRANVMRFISPEGLESVAKPEDLGSAANLASCLTAFTFSDGTRSSGRVLGALRDFRDNILAGTEFGDWFIDRYYNVWSPALLKHADVVAPVYKVIITPVAYVCGVVANL